MQHHQQFCLRFRIANPVKSRSANWQLWPLAVTVLRTGLISTKGHPLQDPLGLAIRYLREDQGLK